MPDLKPGYNPIRSSAPWRGHPPSLRANGSRERAPDDRLREAIQLLDGMDCFVALLLAMTAANEGVKQCLKKTCSRESGFWSQAAAPGSGRQWDHGLSSLAPS